MSMLQVAKVLKPQGIKGEIKVELFTSDIEFIKKQKSFEIDGLAYHVKSIRIQQKYAYIQTEEILSRNDAELFRNKILSVKKPAKSQEPEDEYYISDLENCCVVDENEKIIGYVESVEKYGSVPTINILLGGMLKSFPFLKRILKQVDIENKKIVVYKHLLEEVLIWK